MDIKLLRPGASHITADRSRSICKGRGAAHTWSIERDPTRALHGGRAGGRADANYDPRNQGDRA